MTTRTELISENARLRRELNKITTNYDELLEEYERLKSEYEGIMG